uniref:Putative ovule protein n=1 Tax=Solanum chacoense TaxID=4108 RepID=A0A0V0GLN6_SOLCH
MQHKPIKKVETVNKRDLDEKKGQTPSVCFLLPSPPPLIETLKSHLPFTYSSSQKLKAIKNDIFFFSISHH